MCRVTDGEEVMSEVDKKEKTGSEVDLGVAAESMIAASGENRDCWGDGTVTAG